MFLFFYERDWTKQRGRRKDPLCRIYFSILSGGSQTRLKWGFRIIQCFSVFTRLFWSEGNLFFCIFVWRARVCRPLLCLCRPFFIFEGCLDSNPEYCRSKLARYRLSHPSLYLATHPSYLAAHPFVLEITNGKPNARTLYIEKPNAIYQVAEFLLQIFFSLVQSYKYCNTDYTRTRKDYFIKKKLASSIIIIPPQYWLCCCVNRAGFFSRPSTGSLHSRSCVAKTSFGHIPSIEESKRNVVIILI